MSRTIIVNVLCALALALLLVPIFLWPDTCSPGQPRYGLDARSANALLCDIPAREAQQLAHRCLALYPKESLDLLLCVDYVAQSWRLLHQHPR